jgi:hypothetical protein
MHAVICIVSFTGTRRTSVCAYGVVSLHLHFTVSQVPHCLLLLAAAVLPQQMTSKLLGTRDVRLLEKNRFLIEKGLFRGCTVENRIVNAFRNKVSERVGLSKTYVLDNPRRVHFCNRVECRREKN